MFLKNGRVKVENRDVIVNKCSKYMKILYKISGTVIDTETELPLDKVKIMYQSGSNEDLWPKTFTDEQGNYELEAEIEISQEMGDTDPIPTGKVIDNEIPITFTKDEYNTEEKIPYAKDDTVKQLNLFKD